MLANEVLSTCCANEKEMELERANVLDGLAASSTPHCARGGKEDGGDAVPVMVSKHRPESGQGFHPRTFPNTSPVGASVEGVPAGFLEVESIFGVAKQSN